MAENEEQQEETATTETETTPPLTSRFRGIAAAQDRVEPAAVARSNPERLVKAFDLARRAAEIAEENKADSVLVLDMRKLTSLVDFFVIATVPSRRQAGAITGQIEVEMKKRQEAKYGLEESESGRWTLLDYGDVVIHVFSPEGRDFYNLEDLWGDAPRLDWKDPSLNIDV